MDKIIKKQRTALKKSIAHWERMRDDPDCGEYPCANQCACCVNAGYSPFRRNADCTLCPIYAHTGKLRCRGTPYYKASYYYDKRGLNSKLFKRWAQHEIDFLNEVLDSLK